MAKTRELKLKIDGTSGLQLENFESELKKLKR